MSTPEEIGVSVKKLLEEIDNLQVSRKGSASDPTKGTYFQCLIFQKFSIIDSVMRSCSEARKEVKEQVLLKRRELKAEVEDLNGMLIPRSIEVKMVEEWKSGKEEDSFPFYLSLPPEVRRMILGYLSSPSDKLNLTKAVPSDGEMMEWHVSSLRLELVLEIVFEWDRNHELDYKENLNLCLASADLQDVVKNCFVRTLANPFVVTTGKNYVGYCFKSAPRIGQFSKTVVNPLPATVLMDYDFNDDSDDKEEYLEWKLWQMESLRKIGDNVWSIHVDIRAASSSLEMLRLLRDCLDILPNLKNLTVDIDLKNEEDAEELEGIQLPELGHLQVLELKGYEKEKMYQKLLEKYRSRLNRLVIRLPSSLPVFPVGETAYPFLTHLDLDDLNEENGHFDWDPLDIVMKLEGFEGSPLKSLRVGGGYENNEAQGFISVLRAISQFGATLEYLSVEFAFNKLPSEDDQEIELVNLVNLKFPKVKTLDVRYYPRTWTFLLGFPALEHLNLNISSDGDSLCEAPSAVAGWSEMDLSLVQEELYTSHVWKLLPFLKTVEVTFGHFIKPFQVTRTQCRTFQRKSVEMKKQVSHADITVKGPVDSIVQSSDTTLVVEEDVNGDLVQEGNGCILVNGKVQGKIDQKGDGKIFVCGKHHGALVKTGSGVVRVDCGNVNN